MFNIEYSESAVALGFTVNFALMRHDAYSGTKFKTDFYSLTKGQGLV